MTASISALFESTSPSTAIIVSAALMLTAGFIVWNITETQSFED